MTNVIYAVAVLGILGAVFGALLAYASRIFHAEHDERIDEILAVLPGANCGGCGFPGCAKCAESIVAGKAKVSVCPVGGPAVAAQVAGIMGVEDPGTERIVSHVYCCGGDRASQKFEYDGLKTCAAANKVAGSHMACPSACLGFGSCVAVCKYDAIHVENGVARVDTDKCVACGACVAACPKGLIELVPARQKVFISCRNTEKGVAVRNKCQVGCIACTLCAKKCPAEAITIENNLARIDYAKCTNCGICATVCPRKLIVDLAAKPAEAAPAAPAASAASAAGAQ
ncbi:MAG: RnfABCDGE type electron transport complex subunit B [Clostridia bacterium]|nr:RnfABCDGE type electron transport complex subunit B [Clostridia bacterium]